MTNLPLSDLVLSREVASLGLDPVGLRRARARGELVRVRRGAYLPVGEWDPIGIEARHVLTAVAAVRACRSRVVLSHVSAALLHGCPLLGAPPRDVHVSVPEAGGSRREHGFVEHARALDDDDVVHLHGVPTVGLPTALVDVALTESFARAVAMVDHALCGGLVTQEALFEDFDRRGTDRGRRRVEAVVDFASPLAQSALESSSRVGVRRLGFPDPELQHEFCRDGRLVARVDFWWPDEGVVGEADGATKYDDPDLRAGRTGREVVRDEKRREDDVREFDEVRGFTRWGWSHTRDLETLRQKLVRAGLQPVRASSSRAGVRERP